jgi:CDGSH-type Zn-finger protein/uncharacterized Fe-S cluster protein YjdI
MATDSKVTKYPGKHATVAWHGGLCIHVGECGRAKGELFVGGRQPWCQPDVADQQEVREVIGRCPTGALSAEFADGAVAETASPRNTVTVAYNGPLFLRGDLDIEGAPDDAPALRFRAALCRCGQSNNKPFCDNSHEAAGFKDYGAVGESGDAGAAPGGPLSIKGAKNGPLLLKGNVTLIAASGREAWHGKQVALCRCGESANKPFCDGAHKKIGFSTE